jgi:hypothetical protein
LGGKAGLFPRAETALQGKGLIAVSPQFLRHTGASSFIMSGAIGDDLFVLRKKSLIVICEIFGFDSYSSGDLKAHAFP